LSLAQAQRHQNRRIRPKAHGALLVGKARLRGGKKERKKGGKIFRRLFPYPNYLRSNKAKSNSHFYGRPITDGKKSLPECVILLHNAAMEVGIQIEIDKIFYKKKKSDEVNNGLLLGSIKKFMVIQ
jgi:hypothetical protein